MTVSTDSLKHFLFSFSNRVPEDQPARSLEAKSADCSHCMSNHTLLQACRLDLRFSCLMNLEQCIQRVNLSGDVMTKSLCAQRYRCPVSTLMLTLVARVGSSDLASWYRDRNGGNNCLVADR